MDRNSSLAEVDPIIAGAIDNEVARQANGLELIASENFVSEAVLEAAGSVFTNKYAEGYPGKRYYGGCEWTDVVEQTAIDRAKELFGADHANVQPHSGAQANMSVYLAAIQYGDQILGMNLSHGGHLTHGHPLNFSGLSYKRSLKSIDRSCSSVALQLIRARSISNVSDRSLAVLVRACLPTSLTLLDQSPPGFILHQYRTRITSQLPRIRRCVVHAVV